MRTYSTRQALSSARRLTKESSALRRLRPQRYVNKNLGRENGRKISQRQRRAVEQLIPRSKLDERNEQGRQHRARRNNHQQTGLAGILPIGPIFARSFAGQIWMRSRRDDLACISIIEETAKHAEDERDRVEGQGT